MPSNGSKAICMKCEGCSQIFCLKHVVEHRQVLTGQLDEILHEQTVLQQATNDNEYHTKFLMDSIQRWEEKSIEKIRQMANDLRQRVTLSDQKQKSNFRRIFSFV